MGLRIKVCGVTTAEDAAACVALGVDWLGLNFVPGTPRAVDLATAGAIRDAVRGRAELVGVVADRSEADLQALRQGARLDRLQLHGNEPPELVRRLAPYAFKALRVGGAADVAMAETFSGVLLLDAKVPGVLGGSGRTLDLSLVMNLAKTRKVILAGGLTPGNVAVAVRTLKPWGVDVASGVERSPRVKDLDKVRAFVESARLAGG
jgi:phosphoribosylanthranilate isomerase